MDTTLPALDDGDGGVLDHEQAGPTAARMYLGAELRHLREDARVTREDAGEAIRASASKISRLELGRTGFKLRDVADLLELYGLHDEAERATLLALARHANTPDWWHSYSDVVPAWFDAYLGLEQAASLIRSYEVQFIPGLLQTEQYARAVLRLADDATGERLERRLAVRMHRKQILHRPSRPHLWAVIDEAALRRPIGGAAALRGQIEHLITIAELSHVKIPLLPFRSGGHAAAVARSPCCVSPAARFPASSTWNSSPPPSIPGAPNISSTTGTCSTGWPPRRRRPPRPSRACGGCATRYDRGQRQWSSGRGPRLRMVLIAKVLRASTTDGIARIWLSSSSS